ncbi:YegS/Rv2252/BmrU family lipid kinase [bacterium]|jgi:YegS/Rv2252/BmrU family lipid kinase|nr:YegS/Rv2252/BmrU family lipid kinase [bacterium]|tara:strand:+ start:23075 stop:23950 length:876 start_codon:yes stop_codon:yes gene_type:complete
MKKYIVIYNVNSRGKNLTKEYITQLFQKHDLECKIFMTRSANELDEIIEQHKDEKLYSYCAIGGDGTINSLIDMLLKKEVNQPIVACLPSGSGSDFLRTFAIPQNIEKAIQHLKGDSTYLIDTAIVTSANKKKHFVNVLNFGFLADTVQMSEKLPKIVKRFRYPISFWLKLLPSKSSLMGLQTHNYEFNSNAFVISICNAQFFGGGWNISPKSSLQDGLLNIQIFKVTKRKAMKLFFLAKKGLHLTESDVLLKRSGHIKLLTSQSIEIDGDYFDKGPAEIFVKKGSIQLKI